MAVVSIKNPGKWLGLSTDEKPVTSLVGSKFQETDTGKKWLFDGANWVKDLSLIYAIRTAMET